MGSWDGSMLPSPKTIAEENVTPDDLLAWQVGTKKAVSHQTGNPEIFQHVDEKLNTDDMDILCTPRVNQESHQENIHESQSFKRKNK